ncbi:hypothetical protein [Kitasatospora paranensis]|uniref:ABC transporter permease n=1 Tax=Kitasatospora paranensis TaxID=258053 RepID=A0ABW2FRF5_9ACTN
MPRQALRHVLGHLLTPLLMCLGMGIAYQAAFHAPHPHHLEVAVVGTSPQAHALAGRLQSEAGDALRVSTAPTADDARARLMDRALVGAYVPDARAPQLLVAAADSDTSATAAEQVFTKVAAAQGHPLDVRNITPLASGDPTGQGLFFLMVALSIGSYASVAVIGGAGAVLALRWRALLALGVSVAVSAIGTVLAGPVFHIADHSLAALWAMSWLYSAAIVAIGTALHTVLGRWTTLTLMVLFVMLNFTSSGGIFRPELQNGFFGGLHAFWNGAGFVEGARSLLYFDARAGFGGHLATLLVWLAAGAAALLAAAAAERRRARPALAGPDAEEEMAEAVGV